MSLRSDWPLRLLIGEEDCTFLLDNGATFSNSDPGGFEAASFNVPRDMPLTLVGQRVRLDCGLGIAWEGRVAEIQRSLGGKTAIVCQGYGAQFKDQMLAEIFVDRDLTHWEAASLGRTLYLSGLSYQTAAPQVVAAPTGIPALGTLFTGQWAAGALPYAVGLYNGHGIPIEQVHSQNRVLNLVKTDANAHWQLVICETELEEAYVATPDRPTAEGLELLVLTNTNKAYTWAAASASYSIASGVANEQCGVFWEGLAVFGFHGLQIWQQGFWVDKSGVLASDVAEWTALKAPLMQAGVIDRFGEVEIMTQAVYLTPVPLEKIIQDAALFANVHWGVWEPLDPLTGSSAPRFDFRERPEAGTWTASVQRADCQALDLRETLSKLYNTAVVSFTDVAGLERSVKVTRANPYLEEVGLNRTVAVNAGVMEETAATTYGETALAILEDQARVSGAATLTTTVTRDGVAIPAWMLRSGIDRLRIDDLPGSDAFGTSSDVAIKRVTGSLSANGFSTAVELGTGANLMETLTARLEGAVASTGYQ